MRTIDGTRYDLQAAGEFVALESTADDALALQVRMEPHGTTGRVSVLTAVATRVGGQRVTVTAGDEPPLRIDGRQTELADEASISLPEGGAVRHVRNRWIVSWVDGSSLSVAVVGRHLDIELAPATELLSAGVRGLLGDADGDPANDFRTRDGAVIEKPLDVASRYGVFAESWRISQDESLFDYEPGEDTTTFTDRGFPSAPADVDDLDPEERRRAEAACREAGVSDEAALEDCIIDLGFTGDESYIVSALDAQALGGLAEAAVEATVDDGSQRDGGSAGDAGSSPETAKAVAFGSIEGELVRDDGDGVDVYSLVLPLDALVTLDLRIPEGVGRVVVQLIYDDDPVISQALSAGATSTQRYALVNPEGAAAFLRVANARGGAYALDLSAESQWDGGPPGDAGAVRELAKEIAPVGSFDGAVNNYRSFDTRDWYRFTAATTGAISIEIAVEPYSNGGLRLEAWDGPRRPATTPDVAPGERTTVSFDVVEGSTYWLQIGTGTQAFYTVTFH